VFFRMMKGSGCCGGHDSAKEKDNI